MTKKPKILFAIPPGRFALLRDIGNEPTIPIGLAYVATYVADKLPVEVKVLDAPTERVNVEKFVRIIDTVRPDILAITAYTFQIKEAALVVEEVKKKFPEIKAIIGGYHVNALPSRTLHEFPMFDYAVFGEGEQTAVELILAIIENRTPSSIPGTAYREGEDVITNSRREYLNDISEIPYPDFSLFPVGRYANTIDPPMMFWLRSIPILINRGCPYRCLFCSRSFGNKVRYRPLDHVMGEIERDRKEYRANRLIILDETFTVNREFTMQFTDDLIRRGLHSRIKWMCQTRTELVDPEVLVLMKRSGCRFITFGIESGNEERQRAVEKKLDLAGAREIIGQAMKLGIRVQCTFIIGLPGETEKTAGETIDASIDLDPSISTYSILTPFPGTVIYDMAVRGEKGLRLLTQDWSKYGKQVAGALELEDLPLRRLLALQNMAYRKFYLRPKKIINTLLFVSPFKMVRYLFGYIWRMYTRPLL